MATDSSIQDLEDLARRYDHRVLREYLHHIERDGTGGLGLELSSNLANSAPSSAVPTEDTTNNASGDEPAEALVPVCPEVYHVRPRFLGCLRILLVMNFVVYWSSVAFCGYMCHLRVSELGLKALPPLEVSLLGTLVLGTQATLEFAASAGLTQPAGVDDAQSTGFRTWDGVAWLVGAGSRCAILLDVQVLPLLWQGSHLLFYLSAGVFLFSIGIFVFGVQLRLLCGLCCAADQFAYDKPDLFFKGRDTHCTSETLPFAARPPTAREVVVRSSTATPPRTTASGSSAGREEEALQPLQTDVPMPLGTIKVANLAHISDLMMLHVVLTRLYIPIGCQESQEFVLSITSFSRCFCEDVIQCSVKFFFLMDCQANYMVFVSLFVSAAQAMASCFYTSTSGMDIRIPEDGTRD